MQAEVLDGHRHVVGIEPCGHVELKIGTEAVTSLRTSHDDAQIPARTAALQHEIWTIASRIAQDAPTPISAQFLVSLNEVFDLALSERWAFRWRVSLHILRSVVWTSWIAVAALGFHLGMLGSRQFAMSTLLILMWASSMVLISDIDRAGQG